MAYTIFDEMRKMQDHMDNMFRGFFDDYEDRKLIGSNSLASPEYRNPVCETWETEKDVVAEIELPGVDKKDIKVNVSEDGIEVKTENKSEDKIEDKKKGMYKLKRNYCGFYRRFPLPKDVDANKADAEYNNGILRITVPKLNIEKRKQKLIEVR